MKPFSTLFSLSSADRRLFGEALLTTLIARGALWVADVAWLRRWAARPGLKGQPVSRIVWATQAACRRVPRAAWPF